MNTTPENLAAAIVSRLRNSATDSAINHETVVANMIREAVAPKEYTVEELNAELVNVLKQDKQAIDWLEDQGGLTTCGFQFKWFSDSGLTLREAIRERIQSEQIAKTIEQS